MDDDAANTTIADSSGRGNYGTAQQSTSVLSTTGQIKGALTFNGIGDYISVPDRDDWTSAGEFTITLWVKFDTFNSNWWESAFIGHDEGPGETNKWTFSYDPADNRTLFHINGPDMDGVVLKGNSWVAQPGVWYFIALSRTGNTYTFYRDGVADGSEANSAQIPDASSPLTIGWAEGAGAFDGAIDDVRIYNKALSASQIQALCDEGAGI